MGETVFIFIRGGSRTSPRRGHQTLGGRLPNILVIFSEKSYEIKEILVRRGGRRVPGMNPLNPPLFMLHNLDGITSGRYCFIQDLSSSTTAVANPEFPGGNGPNCKGGSANLLFWQISPKTARKKNLIHRERFPDTRCP